MWFLLIIPGIAILCYVAHRAVTKRESDTVKTDSPANTQYIAGNEPESLEYSKYPVQKVGDIKPGMTIHHLSFGEGRIDNVINNQYILADFTSCGMKELSISHCARNNIIEEFSPNILPEKNFELPKHLLAKSNVQENYQYIRRRSTGSTTCTGYVNKNNQMNIGVTNSPGTDHCQWFYQMHCLRCGYKYVANGSDIWQRRCPKCQGGRP